MVGRLLIRRYLLLVAVCTAPVAVYSWYPAQDRHFQIVHYRPFDDYSTPGDGDAAAPDKSGTLLPMGIGLACGLLTMIPVGIWYHKRQQQLLQEQRTLLGDELHDQLGPMIYYSRMLLASELRKIPDPSSSMLELQHQLAQTGETVRDLSKTLRQEGTTTVAALEAFLCMNLERWQQSGSDVSYVVHGAIPDLVLSLAQYTQLLRVLQELMLNSCRHAPGASIHLGFETSRRRLRIRYWDEGTGFAPGTAPGTGSSSTQARIQRIGGTLELDNRYPQGYEILITLTL